MAASYYSSEGGATFPGRRCPCPRVRRSTHRSLRSGEPRCGDSLLQTRENSLDGKLGLVHDGFHPVLDLGLSQSVFFDVCVTCEVLLAEAAGAGAVLIFDTAPVQVTAILAVPGPFPNPRRAFTTC